MKDTYLVVGLLVLCAGLSFGSLSSENNKDIYFTEDYEYSGDGSDEESIWPDEDGSGSGDYPDDVTQCQEARIEAQRLGRLNERYSGFVPECDKVGSFKATQCAYMQTVSECWCVTYSGEEIEGTRSDMSVSSVSCVGIDRSKNWLDIHEKPIVVDTEKGTGSEPDDNGILIDESGEDTGKGDTSNDIFKTEDPQPSTTEFLKQPLILASGIALVVVFLLCAVLLVMFIVYRMRKKDEGSYSLDEPKRAPSHPYQRAPTKEYFA